MKSFVPAVCIVALAVSTFDACSRKAVDSQGAFAAGEQTQLPCGRTTYYLSADRIDDEVRSACERATQSEEALQAYRATQTRFICQSSDGHVVSSVLVPRAQYDEYDRNCSQYLTVEEAFHRNAVDIGAHQAALKDYIAASNALAKQHLDADNALFSRRRADQASVTALIENRGGSISGN